MNSTRYTAPGDRMVGTFAVGSTEGSGWAPSTQILFLMTQMLVADLLRHGHHHSGAADLAHACGGRRNSPSSSEVWHACLLDAGVESPA